MYTFAELLFFIGMEISLPRLIANWRIPVLGTMIQVVLSVGAIWVVGRFLEWQLERIIVLGFVISLSSSAIVINYLQNKELSQFSHKLQQQNLLYRYCNVKFQL